VPSTEAPQAPPFCPNPQCHFHRHDRDLWHFVKAGFFVRKNLPGRIQRWRCDRCRRFFSAQTFRTDYWLKRPDLLTPLWMRLVACSGARQIAREFGVSPETILRQGARLGRHALLFHWTHRPPGPIREPIALDGFESFEYSQFYPTLFHVVAGSHSHYFYGFTDTELRRKGRMTKAQKRRRAELEGRLGRPDPRSSELEVAKVLEIIAPEPQSLVLHTDEHPAYPRGIRRVRHLTIEHRTISSRAARTTSNPLFPINLLDLLIRHSGANHKRETIAFSKRRQCAAERMCVFAVWRNFMKSVSEQKQNESPAMRLGLTDHRWSVEEVLADRLFYAQVELPSRWQHYYWRQIKTRSLKTNTVHRKCYAA
jgi:transposase-like protein